MNEAQRIAMRWPKSDLEPDVAMWIEQINRAMAAVKTTVVSQRGIAQWQIGQWLERLDQIEREIEKHAGTIAKRTTLTLNRRTT